MPKGNDDDEKVLFSGVVFGSFVRRMALPHWVNKNVCFCSSDDARENRRHHRSANTTHKTYIRFPHIYIDYIYIYVRFFIVTLSGKYRTRMCVCVRLCCEWKRQSGWFGGGLFLLHLTLFVCHTLWGANPAFTDVCVCGVEWLA